MQKKYLLKAIVSTFETVVSPVIKSQLFSFYLLLKFRKSLYQIKNIIKIKVKNKQTGNLPIMNDVSS